MRRSLILLLVLVLLTPALDQAAEVDTVAIPSPTMSTSYKAVIALPDSYSHTHLQYPVVYVLHGWSGSYADWAKHTDVGPFADEYQTILVFPDGGYAGWYLDSPKVDSSQYETYIAKEVPAWIDTHYRTIRRTEGRAITGLSMGGHGAIALLSKYPDTFIAGGSMSGVMDLRVSSQRYGIAELIGKYEENPQRWKRQSSIGLIDSLQGLQRGIIIDCGVDDFLIDVNRNMHRHLLDLEIPHDYYERPGQHSWDFWTRVLPYHLLYFSEWIAEPELSGEHAQ